VDVLGAAKREKPCNLDSHGLERNEIKDLLEVTRRFGSLQHLPTISPSNCTNSGEALERIEYHLEEEMGKWTNIWKTDLWTKDTPRWIIPEVSFVTIVELSQQILSG
jgi:hypothetical protein